MNRFRKTPIIIRHRIKGRFVKAYILRGTEYAIGSAQNVKIRLLSRDIAGVTCLLQWDSGHWKLIDLGSQPDLKLEGKPFVEQVITEKCTLQIDEHSLEFQLPSSRREIFNESLHEKGSSLSVAKWRGQVLHTSFDRSEVDVYKGMEEVQISEFKVPRTLELPRERIFSNSDLRRPLISTFTILFVFLVIILGLPISKEREVTKPKDNVYTRMIFDSKVLAQKRKQLASAGVKSLAGTGNGNGSISEGAKGQKSTANKAVASLRNAGLKSIIGKIALRASKSAMMIATLAATPQADASINPDQLNGINKLPSSGAVTGKTGIAGNAKGFKVGAIGTGGKGGGTGNYKNGSGLGTGSVGNGEVGIDDTESVIEGGLDREVIAGVIREHLGQIRYCYERQLSANPELYGKVQVKFSIDAGGIVDTQTIGQSTMKSALVEECILRRIATWKFPKPKGGTKVIVSYPFLFKSVN